MVSALFTSDIVYGGLISCAVGGGVCIGQFTGTLIATPGGFIRLKLIIICAMMCAFIGGIAGAGQSQQIASALAVMGSISVGLLESIGNGIVTIIIDDQSEMGTAVGVYGSIRSAGGVLASTAPTFLSTHTAFMNLTIHSRNLFHNPFKQVDNEYKEHSRSGATRSWAGCLFG